MLEHINLIENCIGLAKKKIKRYIFKSVQAGDVEKLTSEGWVFSKKLKTSIQLKKDKAHSLILEDRVWLLFYKMHFSYLSDEGGAKLIINPKDTSSLKTQIDVVAIDDEIALAVECKSSADFKKRPQFQEELGKFVQIREGFTKSIRSSYSENGKKQIVLIMFLNKVLLSANDKERAKNANIILFDEADLVYYENLVAHLGPAAKYQILAEMLPGKEIPNLSIKIPAIKSKMGGYNCYTFSISPLYLLKISYVSHRSKGKASDITTYQRMLAKSRLKKIREFIDEDGIFPTNIVLNFEKGRLAFQKTKQESEVNDDLEVGILGWLDIRPAYKSAWIIDGQHRLFSFSGQEKARKSKLTVLAFENLKPSVQAELFIDINAKQKSVKLSLLQELFAELHWDADDPSVRISAIISKAIQDLNNDPECCLHQRIQSTDGQKDSLRCITLTSLFGQIEKKGFFIVKEKSGSIVEYGPLWGGDQNLDTLKRTKIILKAWLNKIARLNNDWWDIGAAEGGGLAMNDGIATLIAVLRSVFEVLENRKHKLVTYGDEEVCELISSYGTTLGEYLSSLDVTQRKAFRDLRGVAGVTYRTRQCQQAIRNKIPEYVPDGLVEWIDLQKQTTNKNAKELIDKIEKTLQINILDDLKTEYGLSDDLWWFEGVPSAVRKKVSERIEEEKNKRGGKEFYFDLIDYKKIIIENWPIFEKTYGFGKSNSSKDRKTEWLDFINETRKIVAHASSGKTVSLEDYNKIVDITAWLNKQVQLGNDEDE